MQRLTIYEQSLLLRIQHEPAELIDDALISGSSFTAETIQKKVKKAPRQLSGHSSRMRNVA